MIENIQNYRIPSKYLYMYQMTPKPPEMPLNDCIVQFKQTGDEQFLQYFLHFYESKLNSRAESFCLQQGYLHHFQDIKQAMIEAILEKIKNYDPDMGAAFLTYVHRHIEAAAHEYVRQNCGAISPSEYHYDNLRKVMAIFNDMPEATEAERYQAAMEKTGLSEEQVYQHLKQSELFRNPIDIDKGSRNEDDGFLPLAEKVGDINGNPEIILFRRWLYEALISEVDALSHKDYHLLLDCCGLKRHDDWFINLDKPLDWEVLAARLHVGTQESVTENFRSAAATVRIKLEKAHWIEGKHTPKLSNPSIDIITELNDVDIEIIDYVKQKWLESGCLPEFYILNSDERTIYDIFVRESLKLWLY